MASAPLRVIKLGGSLLEWDQLPAVFRAWLVEQTPMANVVIVGGGPIVEGLRTIDRAQRLSVEAAHWLAIRAMSLTAEIAAELLPEAELVTSLESIHRESNGGLQILDVAPQLRAEIGSAGALPASWDVTSDSIAAHVARSIAATELVLLKSAPPPDADTLEALAKSGYVDTYFPVAARGLTVRYVALRASGG